MYFEKTTAEQKTDDLEKYFDKLSNSVDSSHEQLLQAINNKSASVEAKVNDLPTKDWLEDLLQGCQLRKLVTLVAR